jgi:pimeloyl-ACP methyl ester carboxylesterase
MITVLDIDGTAIACRVSARHFDDRKKSLFFVHGSGSDHTIWVNQYAKMNDDFNIAAVDLPGHGRSGGTGERDVFLYAEWIGKMIDRIFLNKPVLVGHSLGAAIGLVLAVKDGEKISGLVPVGGGARMPVNEMILSGLKTAPESVIELAARFSVAKKNRERLSGPLFESLAKVNPDVLYGDFLACDRLDITRDIAKIRIPVLVVCGTEDKMTPPPMSQFLKDHIPGAGLALIEEAGHIVMLEDPQAFNGVLKAFVNSLPEGSPGGNQS